MEQKRERIFECHTFSVPFKILGSFFLKQYFTDVLTFIIIYSQNTQHTFISLPRLSKVDQLANLYFFSIHQYFQV